MNEKIYPKTNRVFGECEFSVDEIKGGLGVLLKVIGGVHCGCCGKYIPNQTDTQGYGWGLCDECAKNTEPDQKKI